MKASWICGWDEKYNPIADVSTPVIKEYCKKYNIEFIQHKEKNISPNWWRTFGTAKNLPKNETVICSDIDLMPVNHDIDIVHDFLEEEDLLFSHDVNGLNLGIFIVRNSKESRQFFKKVVASYEYYKNWPCNEQTAVAYLLYGDDIKWCCCKQNYFNSYPEIYQSGDFIIHTPNRPIEERIAILESFIK